MNKNFLTMSLYSKRQNKKTLGLQDLKGITVLNTKKGSKYEVKFRAEVNHLGTTSQKGTFDTAREAADQANNFYKAIYGNKRAAVKAGYWNA